MPSSLEALLLALELIPPNEPSVDKSMDASAIDNMNNSTDSVIPKADHCVNQFIDYVARYYNTVLDKGGNMDSPSRSSSAVKTYKIEETSPCEVAELAGLFDAETTVYAPNHEKVKRKCAAIEQESSRTASKATAATDATAQGRGANQPFNEDDDLEVISVKRDLIPHATPEHLKRIKQLLERLGYEYSEE